MIERMKSVRRKRQTLKMLCNPSLPRTQDPASASQGLALQG